MTDIQKILETQEYSDVLQAFIWGMDEIAAEKGVVHNREYTAGCIHGAAAGIYGSLDMLPDAEMVKLVRKIAATIPQCRIGPLLNTTPPVMEAE